MNLSRHITKIHSSLQLWVVPISLSLATSPLLLWLWDNLFCACFAATVFIIKVWRYSMTAILSSTIGSFNWTFPVSGTVVILTSLTFEVPWVSEFGKQIIHSLTLWYTATSYPVVYSAQTEPQMTPLSSFPKDPVYTRWHCIPVGSSQYPDRKNTSCTPGKLFTLLESVCAWHYCSTEANGTQATRGVVADVILMQTQQMPDEADQIFHVHINHSTRHLLFLKAKTRG